MPFFLCNFAVLLKKVSGEEGERVDVQKLFGYIGLFTLVALWWLGKRFGVLIYFCFWNSKGVMIVLIPHNFIFFPSTARLAVVFIC